MGAHFMTHPVSQFACLLEHRVETHTRTSTHSYFQDPHLLAPQPPPRPSKSRISHFYEPSIQRRRYQNPNFSNSPFAHTLTNSARYVIRRQICVLSKPSSSRLNLTSPGLYFFFFRISSLVFGFSLIFCRFFENESGDEVPFVRFYNAVLSHPSSITSRPPKNHPR